MFLLDIEEGYGIDKVKELLDGYEGILIVYCKLGGCFIKVLFLFKEAGIEGINVKGGIIVWSWEVDFSVIEY